MRKTDEELSCIEPVILAYLAGIIDGEGCVAYQNDGMGHRRFEMAVKMTDKGTIYLLQQVFGGHIAYVKAKLKRKETWRWRVSSRTACRVYHQIEKYLRIKRQLTPPQPRRFSHDNIQTK